jgi:hypothetical protein
MSDSEIIYDPIRCETHIGDFKISDQLLAEMGMNIEDFLKVYDGALKSFSISGLRSLRPPATLITATPTALA